MSAGKVIQAPIMPPKIPKTIIVTVVKMRKSLAGGEEYITSFTGGAGPGCPTIT